MIKSAGTHSIIENGVDHVGDDIVGNHINHIEENDTEAGTDIVDDPVENVVDVDDNPSENGEVENDEELLVQEYPMKEFEILDDIESDCDDGDGDDSVKGDSSSDESEGYFDYEEIDAMLDEGMVQKKPDPPKPEPGAGGGPSVPLERQKIVLVGE
jgi:hypothetical protein